MKLKTRVTTGAMCLCASLLTRAAPVAAATPAAPADAAGVAARAASAGEGASAPVDVFALIVTNNRSTNLDRPDLQYADDDGARYYQLFTGVAAPERVRLLTRFDRATALSHASLTATVQPPRRAELATALQSVQRSVAEAHRAGRRAEFYFVFAGHGDVEGGIGYLDLEDARIDAAFLEQEVVNRVGADVQHVILDSCNSFFVVNPRKPGGRRFATPKDLALGFAKRHPNVGLFLSTNSEAEVYEWSVLESGIFSHEVRSGLSGAADANGDGRVSYAELAGFVDRANAKLPRANLRPQVFQRGPGGEASAALFSPVLAQGRRVVLGTPERRLWIRGAASERLIDLHKEAGPMTVVVPGGLEQPLSIVEWQTAENPAGRPSVREYDVPAGPEPVTLSTLIPHTESGAARGGTAMFGDLFATAYGPRAYQAFLEETRQEREPVYGVGRADRDRLRHYLVGIARSEREDHLSLGTVGVGLGGVLLATSAANLIFDHPSHDDRNGDFIVGGFGLLYATMGAIELFGAHPAEHALLRFDEQLAEKDADWRFVVANTETELDVLAARERHQRQIGRWFSGTVGTLALAGAATNALVPDARRQCSCAGGTAFLAGVGLLSITAAVLSTRLSTPTERLLRLYRDDPDTQLHIDAAPLPGGLALGLSRRF